MEQKGFQLFFLLYGTFIKVRKSMFCLKFSEPIAQNITDLPSFGSLPLPHHPLHPHLCILCPSSLAPPLNVCGSGQESAALRVAASQHMEAWMRWPGLWWGLWVEEEAGAACHLWKWLCSDSEGDLAVRGGAWLSVAGLWVAELGGPESKWLECQTGGWWGRWL